MLGQVFLFGILRGDQSELLHPCIVLDLLLSTDGLQGTCECFIVDQLADSIPPGESRNDASLVLPDSALKIVGNSDVKTSSLAGQDANEHWCPNLRRADPSLRSG